MVPIITLTLFSVIIILLIYAYNKRYCYWKDRNVLHYRETIAESVFNWLFKKKKSEFEILQDLYTNNENASYVGFYRNGKPRILLRDPELIKDIFVKGFNNFKSRGIKRKETDVLSGNILFLSGNKWKLLRGKFSQIFTSSKMKAMFPLIFESNNSLYQCVKHSIETCNQPIAVRKTISDYTTSVMTSVAFGIESGTIKDGNTNDDGDKNENNLFNKIGRNFFEDNKRNHWLFKYFVSRFRSEDKIFISLFKKVIKDRETSTKEAKRNDFVDLCLSLKREAILQDSETVGDYKIEVTDEILAAQAFFFFLAGNDSAETAISFAIYELAHNKECLTRLHKEIDALVEIYDKPTYECLNRAEYLDRVVKETMRKYPPIGHLQRMCNDTYVLPDKKTIEPGIRCTVSVLAIHRDENFYPNPSKFDPSRFLDEKLQNADYYMPFGKGPRQCMAVRFGTIQVKMGLFALLTHFTVQNDSETPYQQYLEIQDIFVAVKPKTLNVKFVKRN